jgi:hypothetical protein
MLKNGVFDVNSVGKIVASYYRDSERVTEIVRKNASVSELMK